MCQSYQLKAGCLTDSGDYHIELQLGHVSAFLLSLSLGVHDCRKPVLFLAAEEGQHLTEYHGFRP